jgi:hypothetical protein
VVRAPTSIAMPGRLAAGRAVVVWLSAHGHRFRRWTALSARQKGNQCSAKQHSYDVNIHQPLR